MKTFKTNAKIILGYWPVIISAVALGAGIAIVVNGEAVQQWYYYNTSLSGWDDFDLILKLLINLIFIQILMAVLAWFVTGIRRRKLASALCISIILIEIIFVAVGMIIG